MVGHLTFSRLCLSCAAAPCPELSPGPETQTFPSALLYFWHFHCTSYSLSRMIPVVLTEPSMVPPTALGAGVARDGAGSPRRLSCPLGRVHIKKTLHLTLIFLLFVLGSGSRLSMKLELDLLATLLKQKPDHCHPYLHGWSVLQQGLRAWSWSGETAAPSFTLLMIWSTSCR